MDYSPISIPVYKRTEHLKKCIESLKKNDEAKHTKLYIFSDYPLESDFKEVIELRNYLKFIDGFKEVIIHCQSQNMGLINIEQSIQIPLGIHGSVIYLEEDLEVSDIFLKFMNDALRAYEDIENVFSVTGYCQPCLVNSEKKEVGASFFFTAWSCGFWDVKYQEYKKYNSQHNPYTKMKLSFSLKYKFISQHSLQQFIYFKNKCKLNKLTPDLSIGFYIWHKNMLQVFPLRSLVTTNGFDGSGMNCGIDMRFKQIINYNKYIEFDFKHNFEKNEIKIAFKKVKLFYNLNLFSDFKAIIKFIINYKKW